MEDRIDRYLLGRMSEEEKSVFEKDLEENGEFRQEYEDMRLIADAVSSVKMKQIMASAEENYQVDMEVMADRYILGQMNDDEKEEFEAKMSEDITLAALVEQHHLISRSVQVNHLKGLFNNIEASHSIFMRNIRRIIPAVAAACMALIANIGIMFQQMGAYFQYSKAYISQIDPVIIRGQDDIEDSLSDIIKQLSIENKDAIETIDYAQTLINEKKHRMMLENNDLSETEVEFENLSFYEEEVQWYKAIYYMQHHKVYKAKRLLKLIIESNGRYAEMAKRILEENRLF